MHNKVKTNELLMGLYQLGDESAFAELYMRLYPKVHRYLHKRLQDVDTVNDIAQTIFLKFHDKRFLYNSKYLVEQWIFVITKSTLIDYFRKSKSLNDAYAVESAASYQPSEISLEELEPKQQEVLKLKYLDDKTYREIASELNMSEVNARQAVSRALKKLRKLLGLV